MEKRRYARSFSEQLTLRGVLIGALGSALIAASSMYVALRLGALPWPTIFVAILSMTLLKIWGRTNLNEINVTHTAMSAGGMIAGGAAFSLPAIWMVKPGADVSFLLLWLVITAGAALGIIFTALIRKHFIEREALPFPIGIAAAETVLAGDRGGTRARYLFSFLGLSAIFVVIRDGLHKIPAAWTPAFLESRSIFFGVWISPMAAAIGYIIGTLYTGVWFIGAFLAYFILVPLGTKFGLFAAVENAIAFKDSLGIGLMIGTGLGVLVKGILPRAREIYGPLISPGKQGKVSLRLVPLLLAAVAFLLVSLAGMRFLPAALTIVGVWVTTAMAASITGQTGINPMEVFAIIVLVGVKFLFGSAGSELFFIAAVVAVACGLTGDVLNDFTSGSILRTDPRAQLISETVGALIGAVISAAVLLVMIKAYGSMGPGTQMPAPQAYAVSTMVTGLPEPLGFAIGLALGVVLYLFNLPGMTLGIGFYLPMTISAAVFVGGVVRWIESKWKKKSDKGVVIASGLLGGEGVAGVALAISRVLGMF